MIWALRARRLTRLPAMAHKKYAAKNCQPPSLAASIGEFSGLEAGDSNQCPAPMLWSPSPQCPLVASGEACCRTEIAHASFSAAATQSTIARMSG